MAKYKLTIKISTLEECIVEFPNPEAPDAETAEEVFWATDTETEFVKDLGFEIVNTEKIT